MITRARRARDGGNVGREIWCNDNARKAIKYKQGLQESGCCATSARVRELPAVTCASRVRNQPDFGVRAHVQIQEPLCEYGQHPPQLRHWEDTGVCCVSLWGNKKNLVFL